MQKEKAKCPHCEQYINGVDYIIASTGESKKRYSMDVVCYTCPECEKILSVHEDSQEPELFVPESDQKEFSNYSDILKSMGITPASNTPSQ